MARKVGCGKTAKAPTATALSGPFKMKFSGGVKGNTKNVREKKGKQEGKILMKRMSRG